MSGVIVCSIVLSALQTTCSFARARYFAYCVRYIVVRAVAVTYSHGIGTVMDAPRPNTDMVCCCGCALFALASGSKHPSDPKSVARHDGHDGYNVHISAAHTIAMP